jgi:hypothetical protein
MVSSGSDRHWDNGDAAVREKRVNPMMQRERFHLFSTVLFPFPSDLRQNSNKVVQLVECLHISRAVGRSFPLLDMGEGLSLLF